ncbi:hypothetical protein BDP27DRAFT_1493553 [Rhodocollybia butyracea]|uniref:Uncharacterized protein n=1 Tax=Rhodocollybia butyracea TaxID=206335 RepID=A0A9P5TYE1_9AGAR|nr:hypothetical protein BDP27DRAFT_1493553 [Rhodocollybia butyracea]
MEREPGTREGLAEDNWRCGLYGCSLKSWGCGNDNDTGVKTNEGRGVNIEHVDGVVVDGTAEMFARPEPDAYCRGMDIKAGNDMGRARAKARKRSTAMAGNCRIEACTAADTRLIPHRLTGTERLRDPAKQIKDFVK